MRCVVLCAVLYAVAVVRAGQELLRCLVSVLHDAVNRVQCQPPYESLEEWAGESEWQQSQRWFRNYTSRNSSVITDLFAGQLRSEIRCLRCQRRRVAFDPFLDLSLPLPATTAHSAEGDAVTLADCFSAFTRSEELSGADAIFCPHCRAHTPSTKALSLQRLPSVLVLHIKRFEFNSRGGRRKLDTPLAAPLSLELSVSAGPLQAKAAPRSYSLLATINHLGSAHGGGHYIAHARTSSTRWHTFNDSHVQQTDASRVAALHVRSAYVLFYHADQR